MRRYNRSGKRVPRILCIGGVILQGVKVVGPNFKDKVRN